MTCRDVYIGIDVDFEGLIILILGLHLSVFALWLLGSSSLCDRNVISIRFDDHVMWSQEYGMARGYLPSRETLFRRCVLLSIPCSHSNSVNLTYTL